MLTIAEYCTLNPSKSRYLDEPAEENSSNWLAKDEPSYEPRAATFHDQYRLLVHVEHILEEV